MPSIALPVLAALLQAGSFVLDKAIISFRRVTYQAYVGASFPLTFAATLLIFSIVRPSLDLGALDERLLVYLVLSVTILIGTNLLFYRALASDRLSELETLGLLREVPVILLSGAIFADERNPLVIVCALLAAGTIAWAHYEKGHIRISKTTLVFVLWMLGVSAWGPLLSKELLRVWDPVSLELVRSGILAAILGAGATRRVLRLSPKNFALIALTNVISTAAWILYYSSYQVFGVVYTVLIFSLRPLLVYLGAVFLLRERVVLKKIVAFFIVLALIGLAQLG
jgi:uncharacterized membrane protein